MSSEELVNNFLRDEGQEVLQNKKEEKKTKKGSLRRGKSLRTILFETKITAEEIQALKSSSSSNIGSNKAYNYYEYKPPPAYTGLYSPQIICQISFVIILFIGLLFGTFKIVKGLMQNENG
jgi:hypothetical protein